MPVTDTALLLPTFLSANVAASLSVTLSPATWLSDNVTVAVVLPSNTLSTPVAVTVNRRFVIFAFVEAVVLASV